MVLKNEGFEKLVSEYLGSSVERDARAYCPKYDTLDAFAKFTWLAFAQRRQQRDI